MHQHAQNRRATIRCLSKHNANRSPQPSPPSPFNVFRILKNALFATAAGLAVFVPRNAIAKQSVITITDQVPNFTLPSQAESLRRESGGQSIVVKTLNGAKKVAPVVLVGVGSAWALKNMYTRVQQQRLKDFQDQLRSSSYEGLNTSLFSKDSDVDQGATTSAYSPQSQARYKFRNVDGRNSDRNLSSKVKLDIFQTREASMKSNVSNASYEGIVDASPTSPFERAIDEFITKDFTSMPDDRKSALADIANLRDSSGLSGTAARSVAEAYVSRAVSAKIDRAVVSLSFDEVESVRNLIAAVEIMDAAEEIDKAAKLNYIGIHRGKESEKEELYRRYAVHCFTNESKLDVEIMRLQKLQDLLKIDRARSEAILADVSKVMFQVAVSQAMVDGEDKNANMDSVKELYESFGSLVDQDSADSITSEVAVMRIMYALQMLLQQEGSLKDIEKFGQMCQELGVDIDELISRVGVLEKTMGADATQFVDELRDIVKAAGDNQNEVDSAEKTPATD